MTDPFLPHLLDIISSDYAEGLILVGGYGLRIKQDWLRDVLSDTLISIIPEARATWDLDFFLRMQWFVEGAQLKA